MKLNPADIATALWDWESSTSGNDGLDAVERDIKEAIENNEGEDWYSPLMMVLVDDRWVENRGYSDAYIDSLEYAQIQGENQRELDRYNEEDWLEHLRRKKDGIV